MSTSSLPLQLAKSKEKLTDRGAVAIVNEFAQAVGLPEKVEEEFPAPGSNRGIAPSACVWTLICYFSEGGRYIEDTRQNKADGGFRSPMDLGYLSNVCGARCSFVKLGLGNSSPQVDIAEAVRHILEFVKEHDPSLHYVREDGTACQSHVINLLAGEDIGATITADLDEAVTKAIREVPEGNWRPFRGRDGFRTGREIGEAVHTMNDSDNTFRLGPLAGAGTRTESLRPDRRRGRLLPFWWGKH